MLPTSGDSLAPPRPDRAQPRVTALTVVRQERSERSVPDSASALPGAVALAAAEAVPPGAYALAPAESVLPGILALLPAEPVPPEGTALAEEPRGCLYALSQPPLMLFLCVIATLIGLGAAWDMIFV